METPSILALILVSVESSVAWSQVVFKPWYFSRILVNVSALTAHLVGQMAHIPGEICCVVWSYTLFKDFFASRGILDKFCDLMGHF